jgi:anti-sigma factor RsiW
MTASEPPRLADLDPAERRIVEALLAAEKAARARLASGLATPTPGRPTSAAR